MAKVSISKKVDGNELDLSMSEISLIPVKDLVNMYLYHNH